MALKEKALKRLAEKLNTAGIPWALAGDYLLVLRGLTDQFHTFELFVEAEQLEAADKKLTRLGMRHEEDAGVCAARISYHFDGADILLTAAPAAACEGTIYRLNVTAADKADVLGVEIPLLDTGAALVYALLTGNQAAAALLRTLPHDEATCLAAVDQPLPDAIKNELN